MARSEGRVELQAAADPVTVTLRDSQRGDEIHFEVARTGVLRSAMADACAEWGRLPDNTFFLFQGREVLPNDTPELIGMTESGGAIEVRRREKVATSGREFLVDHPDQHVEARVDGMIAVVSEVQRAKRRAGCICYFLFCLNFLLVVSLVRPVGKINEIQSSIYRDLALERLALAGLPTVLQDAKDWGDVWNWVDNVLVAKVFNENYYGSSILGIVVPSTATRAPYSLFTLGKYNRVVNAIRFRQVRVVASLPQCLPNPTTGERPTQYQQACVIHQPDATQSCDTPLENHQLSRPCWGEWDSSHQDISYPSEFQLETAQAARNDSSPQNELRCVRHCDEVLLLSSEDVPSQAVLTWVLSFKNVEDPESGAVACRAACDTSQTALLGNLSELSGYCGSSEGKPLDGAGSERCWGDVVDLPLEPTEATRLVVAMKRERWTSEGTRSLAIDLNTYNPNFGIATAVRVVVEADAGGRLVSSVSIVSCPVGLYRTIMDYFRGFFECVFIISVMWCVAVECKEIYVFRWRYCHDLWNCVDLSNLVIYLALIGMHVTYVFVDDVRLQEWGGRRTNEYFDLYTIASSYNNINMASFNFIYGAIRFLEHLRFHPKFEQLFETVRRSVDRASPIVAIYVALLFSFACAGHWCFGQRSASFQSLGKSMLTLTLSVKEGIDYKEISRVAPVAAPLFHFSWFVVSWAVLVNMIVAVVICIYQVVQERFHRVEDLRVEAVSLGIRVPSPLYNFLDRTLPKVVWKLTGLADSYTAEERESSWELQELLLGADIHALWQRLLDAVEMNEETVDAEELSYLFDGSQKRARMFINHVCVVAGLPRVDPPEVLLTATCISELQAAAERLEEQLAGCGGDLKCEFPELEPHLTPEESESEDPERAEQRDWSLKESQSRRAALFKSLGRPPEGGDLITAAYALKQERICVKHAQEKGREPEDSLGVHGRQAVRNYVKRFAELPRSAFGRPPADE